MAEHPPLGVWRQKLADPVLDFRPVRQLCNVTSAHAYLLAVEEEPDRGLEELIPVIRAMNNIQRTGPLLLHEMIAAVALEISFRGAQSILDLGPTSEKVRAELREALEGAPPASHVMVNMFGGEIEHASGVLDQAAAGSEPIGSAAKGVAHWVDIRMPFAGPLIFNRNRTLRNYAESVQDAEALALARKLDELDKWRPRRARWTQQLRNPVGRLVNAMMIPAFVKPVHYYWREEDLRVALLRRLGGK